MQALPFSNLLAVVFKFPVAVICAVLFAIVLDRLANRFHCYGLPRNLLFGLVSGAVAAALFNLYVFLSRNYGLHSVILAQVVTGYGGAVFITVLRRFVFAQRPPEPVAPFEEGPA